MKKQILVVLGVALPCVLAAYTVWRVVAGERGGNTASLRRGMARRLAPADLEVGGRVCLPGGALALASAPRSVVIITRAECPACSIDKAFEEDLYLRCTGLGIPVIYLLPKNAREDARAQEFRSLGRKVVRADPSPVGFSRVPTLAALDQAGIILAMWIGTVPNEIAPRVLREIISGAGGTPYSRIGSTDLEATTRREANYQILTLTEPWKPLFPGAHSTFIPEPELGVRAGYELKKEVPTFVDCGGAGVSPLACQEAVMMISRMSFARVSAVDLPVRRASDYCMQ
jgi:hypothetical protein